MFYTTQSYQYNGYRYEPTEDYEIDENCKLMHDVIGPNGERLQMDWSPYTSPTEAEFKLWVDLSCPNRRDMNSTASLDGAQLLAYKCFLDGAARR